MSYFIHSILTSVNRDRANYRFVSSWVVILFASILNSSPPFTIDNTITSMINGTHVELHYDSKLGEQPTRQ